MLVPLLVACHTAGPPSAALAGAAGAVPPTEAATIRAEYRESYHLATKLSVSPHLSVLCRMSLPGSDYPYHLYDAKDQTITVYANEAAWPAMQLQGERTFAPGSVVVKEKSDGALGVMVKETAAWRYLYVDAKGVVESDQARLDHCVSCHERHAAPQGIPLSAEIVLSEPRDAIFLHAIQE